MLGWLLRAAALLLVVVAAVVIAAVVLLRASLPQYDGEQALAGLSAPVTVERDALGVATLSAATRLDLSRALGFVHAQERFFQMDLLRRAGAGELAALFGAAALDTDRQRRRFRLRHHARAALGDLPMAQQALLRAYTEGVNAGLERLSADPFEYLLLRQRPQPWRMEDSLLVAGSMYFDLTDEYALRALRREQLEAVLSEAAVRFLLPPATAWDAPLKGELPGPVPVPGPRTLDLRSLPPTQLEGTPAVTRTAAERGSNSFAVSAAHSGGQGALVAGDMHLGLGMPNTWYRVRLRVAGGASKVDATGVTLPGLPVLVAGSNGHLAWAFTNSYGVWSERVRLEVRGEPPTAWRGADGWQPLEIVEEQLHVAGGTSQSLRIALSPWGPLVPAAWSPGHGSPAAPPPGRGWHALRWLPAAEGAMNLDLVGMERAGSLEAALSVLHAAAIPPQSVLLAGADGRISWTIAGRIPDRGGPAPQRPLAAGNAPAWDGWLEGAAVPRLLDPPSGRLATANARLVLGAEGALLGNGGYAFGARQQSLRRLLAAAPVVDHAKALAIQTDTANHYLDAWAGLLEQALRAPAAQDYPWAAALLQRLADWQARAEADNALYRLLRIWHDRVIDAALHALAAPVRATYPDFVMKPFPSAKAAVLRAAGAQADHLVDPRYGSWPAFLLAHMDSVLEAEAAGDAEAALRDGSGRALLDAALSRDWGSYNRLAMRHPLSRALPLVGRWLDAPAQRLPGDVDTVRVQRPSFGASQRMAVSPGREADGYFHMPGGQSGHPLSPHYLRGHDAWVAAAARPFLPGAARHRLRLHP